MTNKNADLFKTEQQEKQEEQEVLATQYFKNEVARQIGKNLAIARRLAGFSQTQVMENVFSLVDQKNRLSEIENGKMPDTFLLQRLCVYYGVSADWVLGFTAEPDVDRNASRASILFRGLFEAILPTVRSVTMELSSVGAQFIEKMPESEVMDVIESAKSLIKVSTQSSNEIRPELSQLMNAVRNCEVRMSRQQRELYKQLDDMAGKTENVMYTEVLENCQRQSNAKVNESLIPQNLNLL